ncbi:MAG: hypothetical protein IE909_11085 [Campylobacterales bacterium]|nr:hypothetical protein [Campylobacterales bacterium]
MDILSKKPKTHGEVYVFRKDNIDFKESLDTIVKKAMALPKRMSRSEASRYYSIKFTAYWLSQNKAKKQKDEQVSSIAL